MHDILLQIIEKKKRDLIEQSKQKNKFKNAILGAKNTAIITELKFASPTIPQLGTPTELLSRAKEYEQAGATAISIITEKHFFKGDPLFIKQVKETVSLPLLQKDFVIDASQIYEAKVLGSDALLLIARLVDTTTLQKFVSLAQQLGIEPVVEINDEEDLEKALATTTEIIAVNARDLQTFHISVPNACDLLKKIPSRFVRLGFSGIHTAAEVAQYTAAGADGVLVGTSIMRAKNISDFISKLRLLTESRQTKVKICGIRSLADAKGALAVGADYLGFNFVKSSKRYIDPSVAKDIIAAVKNDIPIVGVFQNVDAEIVNLIADLLQLDYVQLHGEENAEYIRMISRPVIKRVSVQDIDGLLTKNHESGIKNNDMIHNSSFILLDRDIQGKGEIIDLEKAAAIAKRCPIFFAGGLTPENVGVIVEQVRPFVVDVAGGIETDGIIDNEKVKQFVNNAKGGDK